MKIYIALFYFIITSFAVAQNLEEQIYTATEHFNASPNATTLSILNTKIAEFKPQLNTKDHYFAFVNLLVNKAYYLSTKNTITEAIITYENAHSLYETQQIYQYDIVEYCLIPLAILYHKTNAYIKAERLIKYYMALAKKHGNEQQQISGNINLAKLYQSLNKHKTVIEIINEALAFKGITKQQRHNLIYIKEESERLLQKKLYKQSQTNLKPDISHVEDIQIQYITALNNGHYKDAFNFFTKLKALKLSEDISTRASARFSFQEAQLYFLLGDSVNALDSLNKALSTLLPSYRINTLPDTADLYADNTFIDVFDLLAELQTDQKKAIYCYELSFYVSELLANENTSQESFILSATVNRTRSERCIDILYNMYIDKAESTYFENALEFAELNKVLALKWYRNKSTLLEQHPEDSLLLKESFLLKQQQQLINTLTSSSLDKNEPLLSDSLRLQLITVGKELKEIKDSIHIKYDLKLSFNLKRLKSKLTADKACMVEYFFGKKAIYQFVVSSKHIDFKRIELNESHYKTITNFIDYFNDASAINNDVSKFTLDALELYKLLKVKNVYRFQNVLIIPDGILNFVPFDALLTEKPLSEAYSKMPFMVKNHTLAYNTSALFYLNNTPYQFKNSVLGVFPVFENSNLKLGYSITEAESIDQKLKAKFFMHNAAKKQDVLNEANQYSILHLSTHASSGNFNTEANIDFIDSKLYLRELYNVSLTNDLVVLSACETGVGLLQRGEGVMNLARGFKYAGVDNIIFSLWEINDLSTAQLMASFYDHLHLTASAFKANRASKLSYLNNSNISNIKKSPYYWSAFVYYGDLTTAKQNNGLQYIIYILIIIGIAIFLWLKKR